MCILGGLFIYVGCCAQLSVCHFGSCPTHKNPISILKKCKMHFSLEKTKLASMAFLITPSATRVSGMDSFRQTMP
jgi:hypothetical protein